MHFRVTRKHVVTLSGAVHLFHFYLCLPACCYAHHAHIFLPFKSCENNVASVGFTALVLSAGAYELTGILLGCCSRISLTSSTLCSAGQKNRLRLMEMYNQTKRSAGRENTDKTQTRSEAKQTQILTHEQREKKI